MSRLGTRQFKVVTYEEARLEYFKSEYEQLARKLDYWSSAKRTRDRSWMDIEDRLNEIGKQMQFIKDAIEALKQKDARMTNLEKAFRDMEYGFDKNQIVDELIHHGLFICGTDCKYRNDCLPDGNCIDGFTEWAFAEVDDGK